MSQLSTKGDAKVVGLYSRVAKKEKNQGNRSFGPHSNEKFLAKGHYTWQDKMLPALRRRGHKQ